MKCDKVRSQIKFIYNQEEIEIETFLDSIDISDNIGKEVVIAINSDISNN